MAATLEFFGYKVAASLAEPLKITVYSFRESRSNFSSAGVPFHAFGGLVYFIKTSFISALEHADIKSNPPKAPELNNS